MRVLRTLSVALLVGVLVSAVVCANDNKHYKQITELKVEEFQKEVITNPRMLVLFDAGWCPTSVAALKTLRELVNLHSHKLQELGITVAKVKGADHPDAEDVRKLYGIEEYPHISLFLHGGQVRYLLQVDDTQELLSFLDANAHSDTREATLELINSQLSKENSRVLMFTGNKLHPRFSVFLETCLYFKEIVCFHGGDHLVIDNWKLGPNQLYVLGNEQQPIHYKSGWRREKIMEWVHQKTVIQFGELTEELAERILNQQMPTIFLLLGPEHQTPQEQSEDHHLLEFLRKHANIYSSQYLSVFCKEGDKTCTTFLKQLPATLEHPALALVLFHPEMDEPLLFVYKHDEINKSLVHNWITDVQQGKVMMKFKSEQDSIQSDGLLKIGYQGIKQRVGGDHDMLLLIGGNPYFHSSDWNAFRKTLSEIHGYISKSGHKDPIIAYFDKDSNSHYGLNLETFGEPTLRYYRKHEAKPAGVLTNIKQQTVSSILEFIEDLSSEPRILGELEPDI